MAPIVFPQQQLADSDDQPIRYWITIDGGTVVLNRAEDKKALAAFDPGSFSTISIDGIPLFSAADGNVDFTIGKQENYLS